MVNTNSNDEKYIANAGITHEKARAFLVSDFYANLDVPGDSEMEVEEYIYLLSSELVRKEEYSIKDFQRAIRKLLKTNLTFDDLYWMASEAEKLKIVLFLEEFHSLDRVFNEAELAKDNFRKAIQAVFQDDTVKDIIKDRNIISRLNI